MKNSQSFRRTHSTKSHADHADREKLVNLFEDLVDKLVSMGVVVVSNVDWAGEEHGEEEAKALRRIGFLFKGYRVGAWYWELVELLRKLIFTGLLVFFAKGSQLQVVVGFLVAAAFLMFTSRVRPFRDSRVERVHTVASTALSITLLYALVLEMVGDEPEEQDQKLIRDILSWLSFFMNCFVIFFPVLIEVNNSRISPRSMRRHLRHRTKQATEAVGRVATNFTQSSAPADAAPPSDGRLKRTTGTLRARSIATARNSTNWAGAPNEEESQAPSSPQEAGGVGEVPERTVSDAGKASGRGMSMTSSVLGPTLSESGRDPRVVGMAEVVVDNEERAARAVTAVEEGREGPAQVTAWLDALSEPDRTLLSPSGAPIDEAGAARLKDLSGIHNANAFAQFAILNPQDQDKTSQRGASTGSRTESGAAEDEEEDLTRILSRYRA